MTRHLRRLVVMTVFLAAHSHERASAQGFEVVGLRLGALEGDFDWTPETETEARRGLATTVFGRVSTPAPWLSVEVSAGYVQRGGRVRVVGAGGTSLTAEVRSDYLAFRLLPEAGLSLGPVRFFVAAGPSLETSLGTRHNGDVTPLFSNPRGPQLLVGAAAGLALRPSFGEVGIGLSWDLGLTEAYRLELESVSHRGRALSLWLGLDPGRFDPRDPRPVGS